MNIMCEDVQNFVCSSHGSSGFEDLRVLDTRCTQDEIGSELLVGEFHSIKFNGVRIAVIAPILSTYKYTCQVQICYPQVKVNSPLESPSSIATSMKSTTDRSCLHDATRRAVLMF